MGPAKRGTDLMLPSRLGGVAMKRLVVFVPVFLWACSSSSPTPTPVGDSGTPPTGWRAAVGEGGTFVSTFDEVTWTARSVAPANLYGVSCVGNDVGWAVGETGAVAHTKDGGQTWGWQQSHEHATLRAVAFADLRRGVAAGDDGALTFTTDGGTTWTPLARTTVSLRAAVATSGALYVVGDVGTLLRSVGDDFVVSAVTGATDLRAVAAAGVRVFVADTAGHVFASTDGGLTFGEETVAPHGLGALSMNAQGEVLAAGDQGTVLRRSSAGVWRTVDVHSTANLHAALLAGTAAYVAGDDGTLLRATGETFAPLALSTKAALWGLESLE